MAQYILDLFNGIDCPVIVRHILASVTMSLGVLLFVVAVGRLVDMLELWSMKLIARFFSTKVAIFVGDRLTFPGVIIHECSHAFFIWATGGKITKVKLLAFGKDGRLGYVNFQTQGKPWQQRCQMSFGSCAPVIMGMFEINSFLYMIFRGRFNPWIDVFLWYMTFSMMFHMSMSDADMKNYFKGMKFVFPFTVVMFMLWISLFR